MAPGALMFWEAWHALRHDRHVGAMGGRGPIFYAAISTYARDHGITGASFEALRVVLSGMEAVYLQHMDEQDRLAAERAKQR